MREIELEVGHVLFIGIVGYLGAHQRAERAAGAFEETVHDSKQFRAADAEGKLIRLADRRWDGAGLPQQPGSAGRMRA